MTGMKLLCVLCSVFCCVWSTDTRARRTGSCSDGTYITADGLQCCLCPEGHHLERDCTSQLSEPACTGCEDETYLDHANSEHKCEPCKQCGNNDNMVVGQRCSPASNTVCRCEDGYYCDKGDECKVCYPCTTCEELGIKEPCNLTSDTQCNHKPPDETTFSPGVIALIVIGLLLVIAVAVAVYLWKRKQPCVRQAELQESLETEQLLLDPDLESVLPKIAEILGIKVALKVVRCSAVLTPATIDNITFQNAHDAGEQAYQLLKTWYEKHSRPGAYKELRKNLIDLNQRGMAENIDQVIRAELKESDQQLGNGETDQNKGQV